MRKRPPDPECPRAVALRSLLLDLPIHIDTGLRKLFLDDLNFLSALRQLIFSALQIAPQSFGLELFLRQLGNQPLTFVQRIVQALLEFTLEEFDYSFRFFYIMIFFLYLAIDVSNLFKWNPGFVIFPLIGLIGRSAIWSGQ